MCKLIIKGFARHHREGRHLMASPEEENQRVRCVDDIRGKALPWPEVRQAQDGNCNICATSECKTKLMNVRQSQRIRSLQLTRSGSTQNKAFEEGAMKIRSPTVAIEFTSWQLLAKIKHHVSSTIVDFG